jgi:integrase
VEEAGFELFVPLEISASPSWWSRARKPQGAPERSFSVAGPIVRIHLPPAASQQRTVPAVGFDKLCDAEGGRLYFTEDERDAFVAAAARAPREVRTFCGVLHATGCRISEALALTAQHLSGRVVKSRTNNRR